MTHDSTASESEFGRGWRPLVAAALGVTCGVTAVPIYTIGAFVRPLEQAFGWSRGAIQSAIVFAYLTLIVAGPVAGALADRKGARAVAIWSVLGIAVAVASAGILGSELWGLYLAYALIGILGAGTSPVVWTRAVSGWFERRRGLALGITLMGTGLFATLGPRYVTAAIEVWGWRGGYLALAAVPVAIVLPAVLLWFRERPGLDASRTARTAAEGVDLPAALRTRQFWIIAVTFLCFSTGISGFIASFIPLLTDRGFTPQAAASAAGIIGIAVIIGRFAIGFLLDHVRAPLLAAVVMSLPAIGCIVGARATGDTAPLVSAALVGLAGGAEFDLVAYMTARFFGLRHYGKLYGILFSPVIAGAAVGAALFGFGFDRFRSYDPVLLGFAAIFVVAALAQLGLGRAIRVAPVAPATT
jgi:MFS family permease